MALIPGTLPNDTCYGTPQDLLELFAQYLDVPAFALSSKVVFSTTNTGFTSDIVWFDLGSAAPASATRPIMKITVSSLGFVDYVQNYINQASSADPIVGADFILFSDTSASGATKKSLVSAIVALAVPAAGSITPAQLSQPFTSGTAVASTSGTAINFTGIPSWVKRISVIFDGVSTSGTSPVIVQLGDSGGVETSGYLGATALAQVSTSGSGGLSSGFTTDGNGTLASTYTRHGVITILNISSNIWVAQGCVGEPTIQRVGFVGGSKSLSGVLDRIRITTDNGTDTFDAGSVNIMYEG